MVFDPNKQLITPSRPRHIRIVAAINWNQLDTGGPCTPLAGTTFPPIDLTLSFDLPDNADYTPDVDPFPFVVDVSAFGIGTRWEVFFSAPIGTSTYQGPVLTSNGSPVGVYAADELCDSPATVTVIEIP